MCLCSYHCACVVRKPFKRIFSTTQPLLVPLPPRPNPTHPTARYSFLSLPSPPFLSRGSPSIGVYPVREYGECCQLHRQTLIVAFGAETSSSAVVKRARDASCLSLVSFNSTKRRVDFFLIFSEAQYSAQRKCTAEN